MISYVDREAGRSGRFGDALVMVGTWCFHLSYGPDGWHYAFGPRSWVMEMRLR